MNNQPLIKYVFRYLTYFLVIGFTLVFISGCEEDDTPDLKESTALTAENSEAVVKNYVDVNANLQMARNIGSGIMPFNNNGVDGASFKKGLEQLANAKTFTDSIDIDFCGEIDLNINNGSITVTIDFGETGCEQDGDLLKGKITESYSFSNDSLKQSTTFDNFSYNDVTINGTRESSFALLTLDTELFKVKWSEDLTIQLEDGKSYTLKSSLSSSYDGERVVLEGFSIIEEAGGDSYSTTIITPLTYILSCVEEGIYAPVEGKETLVFNGDSVQIDYGSGDCDYLIEITREGETMVVDIAEVYDDIEFAFGFWFVGIHGDDDDYDGDCKDISGDVISETRSLPDFSSVDVRGIANIYLVQGDAQEVIVKAPEDLMPFVTTEVEGEKLIVMLRDSICVKGNYDDDFFLDLMITVPGLKSIEVQGVANISGESELQGDSLYIGMSGAGEVELPLNYDHLSLDVKGASKLTLSGNVETQNLNLTGASYYNGFELESDECEINITGAGKAKVTVNDKLKVTINGAGKVYYKGNPEITSSLGLIGELINAN